MDTLGLGKISVGPPYFESVFFPLMAPALFLLGIGPIARWRKAELPQIAHRLKWAMMIAVTVALLLPLTIDGFRPLTSLGLLMACWIVASALTIVLDGLRGADGRIAVSRLRLMSPSLWGMHLAHVGVAAFVFGVTMVNSYETELDGRVEVGRAVTVDGYEVRLDSLSDVKGPNYDAVRGHFTLSRDGRVLSVLTPEKRLYRSNGQPMTEAAIDRSLSRDVYVSMGEPLGGNAWAVRVHIKPWVNWIWLGCVLMGAGGLLAASDRRYRRAVRAEVASRAAVANP
jgi:cytochrome c-type biogenesis protein CcmF